MFPGLKLLTGDAIFAGRPLLKALQEYERDYLMQVKGNQPNVAAKMEAMFRRTDPAVHGEGGGIDPGSARLGTVA